MGLVEYFLRVQGRWLAIVDELAPGDPHMSDLGSVGGIDELGDGIVDGQRIPHSR